MPHATIADVTAARRIAIHGVTGAGKSTAARLLADAASRPGAPVVTIDYDEDILWAPASHAAWTLRPEDEQRARATELIAQERWVMASVGSTTYDIVMPRVDVSIYLDYPPIITFPRLLRRTVTRALTGETCCNDNKESLRLSFLAKDSILLWWFKTFRKRHAAALAMESAADGTPTLRLTHPRQLDLVIAEVAAAH